MNTIFSDTTLLIILIAVFIIVGITIFLAIKANMRVTLLEEKSRKPKENNIPATNSSVAITEINRLSKRLDALELKLAQPPQPPNFTPVATENNQAYEEKSPEINLIVPKPVDAQFFYMPTPNPDGSFEASYRTDSFRPTVSLYKFTVDANNNSKARFEFHSDEFSIKDVLNNPKTYLEPVCYETNNPFAGARKILTISPGLAVKSGERWLVGKNDKAQIKYE
jgi:hypothetical protein